MSFTWSQPPKTGFLMTWLTYSLSLYCYGKRSDSPVHLFQRNKYGSQDISSETEETLPSLKLIKILKEMSRARTELDRVSFFFYNVCALAHICLVDPSILTNWMSPFPIIGVSVVLFHFYSISNIYSC